MQQAALDLGWSDGGGNGTTRWIENSGPSFGFSPRVRPAECGSPEVDDTGNVDDSGNSWRWLGPCRRRMPLLLYYGSWEAYAKVSLAKDMSGMRYCVQGGCNLHHKHEAPHPPRCQQQRQLIDKQELMRHRESVATPAAGSHRALQSQPLTKPATNSRPENWS